MLHSLSSFSILIALLWMHSLFIPFMRWHPEWIHNFKPNVEQVYYLLHSRNCFSINVLKITTLATISYCWFSLVLLGKLLNIKSANPEKSPLQIIKKNKGSFVIEWVLKQDCSTCHQQPAKKIPKTERNLPFCISRKIQLIMYILCVTKGEIKLLESFDKQHPAQTPTETGRQDAILLDVHISNMSLRPPPLPKNTFLRCKSGRVLFNF